jgi:hypothetical protein
MSKRESAWTIAAISVIAVMFQLVGQGHGAEDQLETESHALFRTIERGSAEDFLKYCTRPFLVAEYLTTRDINSTVEKELLKVPVKLVDASGSHYICNASTLAVENRKTKLALFQQLCQLIKETPEHLVDVGRIEHVRELPQEPSYGISGLRSSNIEWIITLELYKGRAVVSSVKVGSH